MKLSALLTVLLFSTVVWSGEVELTIDNIEGSWEITSMGGMQDDEGDMWEFQDGKFYQNLGGKRISPDAYTIKDNIIDMDGYHIVVIKITDQMLQAKMAGIEYILKKKWSFR